MIWPRALSANDARPTTTSMPAPHGLVLGEPDAAHLGDRVDAVGVELRNLALVREPERVAHRDARLLHRDRSRAPGTRRRRPPRRCSAPRCGSRRRPRRSHARRPRRRRPRARARRCCPSGRPRPAPCPPSISRARGQRRSRARRRPRATCSSFRSRWSRTPSAVIASASRSPISASRNGSSAGRGLDQVHLDARAPRTCTRTRNRSRRPDHGQRSSGGGRSAGSRRRRARRSSSNGMPAGRYGDEPVASRTTLGRESAYRRRARCTATSCGPTSRAVPRTQLDLVPIQVRVDPRGLERRERVLALEQTRHRERRGSTWTCTP